MKISRLASVAVVIALSTAVPVHASTEAVIVGEAKTADGRCLNVTGATSGTATRSRWLTAYWETTSLSSACLETDAHFDPVIKCAVVVTTGTPGSPDFKHTAYLATTGPANASYLFVIVDRPTGTDEFGVLQAATSDGPCGVSGVTTTAIELGGFVLAGA